MLPPVSESLLSMSRQDDKADLHGYLRTARAVGRVPWWPADRSEVALHRILAHLVAETQRHAGHADEPAPSGPQPGRRLSSPTTAWETEA